MMGNDESDGKEAHQLWLLDVATGKLAVKVLTVIQFSVYPRNMTKFIFLSFRHYSFSISSIPNDVL